MSNVTLTVDLQEGCAAWALIMLKNGHKVRRKSWLNKEDYIYFSGTSGIVQGFSEKQRKKLMAELT